MANVFDVAEIIITITKDFIDKDIDNDKLQKLLYFAQGRQLARTGKPLFDAPVEAWARGPVVKDVYKKYSIFKDDPIQSPSRDLNSALSFGEFDALVNAIGDYFVDKESELWDMTRSPGTPWAKVYNSGETVIPEWEIKGYFQRVDIEPTPEERRKKDGATLAGRLGRTE